MKSLRRSLMLAGLLSLTALTPAASAQYMDAQLPTYSGSAAWDGYPGNASLEVPEFLASSGVVHHVQFWGYVQRPCGQPIGNGNIAVSLDGDFTAAVSGSPNEIYVEGQFSQQIQCDYGSQRFYFHLTGDLVANQLSTGGGLTFTGQGTSSVTVQAWSPDGTGWIGLANYTPDLNLSTEIRTRL